MNKIEHNDARSVRSLHGKVFEQLENDILSGKYHPGDYLNELKLSE